MGRIIGCIINQHDLSQIFLAGIICMIANMTTVTLLGRMRLHAHRQAAQWLAAAAVVLGVGVWATHFIAILAFRPGFPVNYDIGLTILSSLMAVGVAGIGFAFWQWLDQAALGGAVVGIGIAAMHYTGFAAMIAPAVAHWDAAYILGSIVIASGFCAAALATVDRRNVFRGQILAALFLTAAVTGLHFTAMAAVTYTPDPTVSMVSERLPLEWLSTIVAMAAFGIVAIGMAGSQIDARVARRSQREADRLRTYILELEATRRQLEATGLELRAAYEQAQAASRSKSQFLAAMSHELRTPLNAIIGFSEIQCDQLLGPLGNPRYLDYSRDILKSGRGLLGLINNILDYSNIDSGGFQLNEEQVDPAQWISGSVRQMQPAAAEAGLTIAAELPGDLPLLVADEQRLRQVLGQVLSNAVKFTPSGGNVRVSARQTDSGLVVQVADTGIGIEPDQIARLTESFTQADGQLSRRHEGIGLGLAVAKKLMAAHGGRLTLASAPGQGTCVSLVFPLARLCLAEPEQMARSA